MTHNPNDTDLPVEMPPAEENGEADGDYAVGYGKPPTHTRFQPGQSGNPKRGKNKPKPFLRCYEKAMAKECPVRVNGEIQNLSRTEAAAENLAIKTVKGDKVAIDLLLAISKTEVRDRRLEAENHHLREKLKKAYLEYEKLKEEKKGGVLVLPPASVCDLESELRYGENPEKTIQRMLDNPEEVKEMVWLLYYNSHPHLKDK